VFKGKKVAHIVAMGLNGEIGGNNKLLWHIREDLRFFKQTTIGNVVVMGRKTIESLPSTLKNRIVVDVSRDGWSDSWPNEVVLESRLTTAVHNCQMLNTDTIFIAGGSSIYEATQDIVDELYVTHVNHEFPHADRFYDIPKDFVFVGDIIPQTKSVDGYTFHVSKYEKRVS